MRDSTPEPGEGGTPETASEEPREAALPPAPRRLELVISGEHGLSEPPPDHVSRPDIIAPEHVEPEPSEHVEPTSSEPPADAQPATAVRIPFAKSELRMLRSTAAWVGLTGVATLGVSAVLVSQWAGGHGTVPSAVAAVLTAAIGFWSVLAGWHFGRVARRGDDDAHHLTSAFSNLRSILILKSIGLFLILGLSCFAFSILASLLALL